MKKFLFVALLFFGVVKNFAQQKEVYTDFLISEKKQEKYEGIYKNGKPFSGYFKAEKMIDDIYFIDFYENGERKFRYYTDYFQNDVSLSNGIYNAKTEYENGKIKNGMDIKNMNNSLIWAEYKNFKRENIFVDIFAMHYFNRISFELKGNVLKIKDLKTPDWRLEIKKIKNNPYEISVFQNDTLFLYDKQEDLKEVKFGTPNSLTYYYKNKKTNALETKSYLLTEIYNRETKEFSIFSRNALVLSGLYYIFSANKEDTARDILERIYENLQAQDFRKPNLFENLFTDRNTDLQWISYLEFNEKGIAIDGGKVTPNPDGKTYKLEIFGKEKKVYEKISLNKIEKLMKNGVVE